MHRLLRAAAVIATAVVISTDASAVTDGSGDPTAAKSEDGKTKQFSVIARADTPEEVSYYHHGGILQYVLRQML